MILISSSKLLLNASKTAQLDYKKKRLVCLCENWLTRCHQKREMTSAVYGIETEDGIFEVKPLSNQHQQQNLSTSLFRKKRFLEFHYLKSTDTNPIEQLQSLQKFLNEQPTVSAFKGFRISEKFQPTYAIATQTSSSNNNDEGLIKTVFELTDKGTLRFADSEDENDYCLIKYQGTHPVFNERLSTFAPIYKKLDQAKSNLSKVVDNFVYSIL